MDGKDLPELDTSGGWSNEFFTTPELMLSCPVYDASNGEVTRIGSATYVMPGLFLTAKHNFEAWQGRGVGAGRDFDVDQVPHTTSLSTKVAVLHYSKAGRVVWHIEQIGTIPGYDVAFLMCEQADAFMMELVNERHFPGTAIGFDMHAPVIGESVVAMGYPGNKISVDEFEKVPPENLLRSTGTVEDMHMDGAGIMVKTAAIQADNEIYGGMSGGPVVRDNYICGLISAGLDPHEDYQKHSTFISMLWEAFSLPITSRLFGKGEPRTMSLLDVAKEGLPVVRGAEHIESKPEGFVWNANAPNCADCPYRQ